MPHLCIAQALLHQCRLLAARREMASNIGLMQEAQQEEAKAQATLDVAAELEAEVKSSRLPVHVPDAWSDIVLLMPRPLLALPTKPALPRALLASLREQCDVRRMEWSIRDSAEELEQRLNSLR